MTGFYTLFHKEWLRFWKVKVQTVLAPVLTALLFLERNAVMVHAAGIAAQGRAQTLQIVAATGTFASLVGRDGRKVLPPEILERIQKACGHPGSHYGPNYFIGDQPGAEDGELLFYIGANRILSRPDGDLIEKFVKHVGIAYENLHKLKLALGRRHEEREVGGRLREPGEGTARVAVPRGDLVVVGRLEVGGEQVEEAREADRGRDRTG